MVDVCLAILTSRQEQYPVAYIHQLRTLSRYSTLVACDGILAAPPVGENEYSHPFRGRMCLHRVKGTHTHTDIDIHPCIQTDIHADTHPDIHWNSVPLAPHQLGSNLRSRSRELATCYTGLKRVSVCQSVCLGQVGHTHDVNCLSGSV